MIRLSPITSIYLDTELLEVIDKLKKRLGLKYRSEVIRLAITELAKKHGVL